MSLEFDTDLLAKAGANLCGDDRFTVICCARCEGQYLFNQELNDIYYDPDNLQRRFFRLPGISMPSCRYCGEVGWQASDEIIDKASVQVGPWSAFLLR